MSEQYIRVYELLVIPVAGEIRSIKDLRINFEITKTVLGFPNLAKISVYNPAPETVDALNEKFTKIVLSAGYGTSPKQIFKGEIRNLFKTRKSIDTVITFFAADGERDWQNSTFNRTFSENVSISFAIGEVIKSFKETVVGAVQGIPEIADKLRGQTLSGSTKDILDNFAEEYGFTWSIQDGEVVVTPVDEALQGEEAIVVKSSTGMIGSPTITEIGANVTTLLNPDMLPNKAIKIESVGTDLELGNLYFRNVPRTSAEGFYKIQEVSFVGDNIEGDWLANIKGRTLSV